MQRESVTDTNFKYIFHETLQTEGENFENASEMMYSSDGLHIRIFVKLSIPFGNLNPL
jgi:hypothetical protein